MQYLPDIRLTNVLQDIPIKPNTLIVGYRRCGKTTKLVELARKYSVPVFTPYQSGATIIMDMASEIAAYPSQVINSTLSHIRRQYHPIILIDEVSHCSNESLDHIATLNIPVIATTSLLDLDRIQVEPELGGIKYDHILIMTAGHIPQ